MSENKKPIEIRAFIELQPHLMDEDEKNPNVQPLTTDEPFDCRVTLATWQGDQNLGTVFVGVGAIGVMASLFPQFIVLKEQQAQKPALSLVPEEAGS